MSQLYNRCFFFSIVLFLLFIATINPASAVIYVGYAGNTGTYNCDGVNDEVQIQQALNAANSGADKTVYLRGPHTYWVDNPMTMYGGTKLTGDSSAEIKLVANAAWPRSWKDGQYSYPLIRNANTGSAGWEIYGFTVDGNSENQAGITPGKLGYYTLIWFDAGCNNVAVHDMRFEWSTNDAVKVYSSDNIDMYNCDVYNIGHEAGYFLRCTDVTFHDNTVYTRVNGATRISGGVGVDIYNNEIYTSVSSGSTGPGIEIDNTAEGSNIAFSDIDIYDNNIHDLRGAAIWMFTESPSSTIATDVYIHHNIIRNVGNYDSASYSDAAIIICRFDDVLIENNVIDDGGKGCVKFYKTEWSPTITGSGFNTVVRNNILMYTTKSPGAVFWNMLPSGSSTTHTLTASYNNIYANTVTEYGTDVFTVSNSLLTDPGVFSRTTFDYHLKSRGGRYYNGAWVSDTSDSICIDAGYPSSTYALEPENNGDRINIGRYGNTAQASKTYSSGGGSAPTGTFSAAPDEITEGESSTLTWTSSGATTASINGVSVSHVAGGTLSVSPTTTTLYTLSLGNTYGTSTYTDTVTVTGTPDTVESYDTRIKNTEATTNFNTLSYIDIGNIDDERTYRGLYWFNTSDYSTPSSSSSLWIYWYYPPYSRAEETVLEVYRPAAYWNPEQVTWNNRITGTAWTNAGGSWYDLNGVSQGTTPYDNVTIPAGTLPGSGKWIALDVTELTNEYIAGTYNDYGYLLKAETESENYVAFASLECGNNSRLPHLSVLYDIIAIDSYLPLDTTPTIAMGETQSFSITLTNESYIKWYVNGTFVSEDDFEDTSTYDYTPLLSGYYNVTAKSVGVQQTWILQAGSGSPTNKMISSYTPVNTAPVINIGTTQFFTVTMSSSDIISWYKDSVLQETEAADLTSSYSFTPTVSGTYNITAIGQNDSMTWSLTSVTPAFEILTTSPSSLVLSYAEAEQTFTATTNMQANITWWLEDTIMEIDEYNTSGSFSYTPLYAGTYSVRADAESVYTNESETYEWQWGVRGSHERTNTTLGGTNDEKFARIKVDLISNIDDSMRLSGIVIVITEALAIIALIAGVWQRRIKVQTAAMAIMVLVIGGVAIHVGLKILEELIKTW